MGRDKNLSVAIPEFSPFFISNPTSGLSVKLIQEVFKNANLPDPDFQFLPFLRVEPYFGAGGVDAAANIFRSVIKGKGYLSSDVFFYRDCFFSSRKNGYKINSLEDLKPYSIVSYAGAKIFQGADYSKAVDASKSYDELSTPDTIAQMVGFNRAEIGMGDMFIFYTKAKEKVCPKGCERTYISSCILPLKASKMIFANQMHRERFEAELKKLKSSGRFVQIYREHFKGILPTDVLNVAMKDLQKAISLND